MLGTLIKKQLFETYRTFFYDQKKGRARSKASAAASIIAFAALMVGVLGGIFCGLSFSLSPLGASGFGWFYYFILGIIGIFLGVFGSVFNTASALYNAKDNDLLLSMPIPVPCIMISRLFAVFVTGALYSGVVVIPAAVTFLITNGVTFAKLAGGILFVILVFLAVFLLSCVLGYVVAAISSRLKNKSVITVIVSLAFFAVYYFVYFKASELIGDIIENAALYGDAVKEAFYPAYLFGSCGTGDPLSLLISFGAVLAALAITCCLIAKSFLKIVTKSDSVAAKTKKRRSRMKSRGVFASLVGREFSRFLSSANYMLNCGIGAVLAVFAAVILLIKGEGLTAALDSIEGFTLEKGVFAVVLFAAGAMLVSTCYVAAPSVSLEGRSLWVIRSLPVDTKAVLLAKLVPQFALSSVAIEAFVVCGCIALGVGLWTSVLTALAALSYCALYGAFALTLGIEKADLMWTSEIYPVKQGAAVTVSLFSGWIFAVVLGVGGYFLGAAVGYAAGIAVLTAVMLVAFALLFKRLMSKGVETFESL